MIEWLIIVAVLFFLGAVFYKQSIQEFKINQIEWDQRHQLDALFEERVPVVVRGIPQSPVWTQDDVMQRDFYATERTPNGPPLRDVIMAADGVGAIWPATYRRHLYDASATAIWFEKVWEPVIQSSRGWLASFLRPIGECYYGPRGLDKVRANWQLIIPTEGAIVVNLMTSRMEQWLPKKWRGLMPSLISKKTVPFADQIKYMDCIVRQGTALWVPAHWYVAWEAKDGGPAPLVCTVDIHTPISYIVAMKAKA
jgi:hypothetical protein